MRDTLFPLIYYCIDDDAAAHMLKSLHPEEHLYDLEEYREAEGDAATGSSRATAVSDRQVHVAS